jgi:monofunctional glycosyltransferase
MKLVWRTLKFCLYLFLLYTAFSVFIILFFRFIDPPVTAYIYAKSDLLLGLFSPNDVYHMPIKIQHVSRYAPLAVIASEDQKFFDHFGFDFDQIEKAMKENEMKKNIKKKRIRGASTVSMQLARNLFLSPGKNIVRKGVEAYYTVLLELLWSKQRILETYLNDAEMGKGIYGIEAASHVYYSIPSLKLNALQAATIIAILPNPTERDPRKPSAYLIDRRDGILDQMNDIGGIGMLNQGIKY